MRLGSGFGIGARIALAVVPLCAASIASAQPVAEAAVDPVAPEGRWSAPQGEAAQTPPMGWSSWNAFRTEITEEKVIGAAQALVSTGLAKSGYVYVNIDDGWWLRRVQPGGRLEVRTGLFPSAVARGGKPTSFRPFVDRMHAMGLKAGLYTEIGRNACSQAYDLHSPNLPTGTTAEREVGLFGHVAQDVRLFLGEWKFDYLKVDACGIADFAADKPYVAAQNYRAVAPLVVRGRPAATDEAGVRALYADLAQAIRREDPKGAVFLSISLWGQADVRSWGKQVGNSWRTGEDITPSWSSMLQSFDTAAGRALYAHPGAWNDPDMLFIGSGDFDAGHLTEARSHMSLWAIINAPLIIGYDLRSAPQSLIDVLGNRDVIAINQDVAGNQGVIAYGAHDLQIVVKTLHDGRKAVALLNRSGGPITANLTAGHLKFADDSPIALRDLWKAGATSSFTGETEVALAPHETRLYIAEGKRALTGGYYLSELPGIINVAVDGVRQSELDPTIARGMSPWAGSRSDGERPVYTGWGGAQADSAPYGTTLTIANSTYTSGIGILAGSRMQVRNDRRFARFSAEVGIDAATRDRATPVRFALYGDGRLLAETGSVTFGAAPVPISADIGGIGVIELVVRADRATTTPVSVVWGNAALLER